ncbi:RND family transporter [Cupriavidus sp. NPDC089707]|uniref:efflux RND transporter permease subunit n=1 Tax=Cupriavidus sp. NPDC089707 TaxID=3363963 RepID=UPI0037F4129D
MSHVPTRDEHPVVRDLEQFDRTSGSLVERLLFNHRLVVVTLCLLITAVLGFQATRLTLGASFEKMIPAHHPYIANYLAHKADLAGMGNVVRIAVENTQGTIYDAEYLETLRKINDDAFLLPGVDRPFMKSLWTPAVRWIGVTEDGLDGGPVIGDSYDGSPEAMRGLRANVERSGEIGTLVAADARSSIVLLPLMERDDATGNRLDYHQLGNQLEQLRARYEHGNIRIHITGFAKIVGDLISGLHQVLLFFALAVAICTAVLFWYTRCWRSTFLVVFCSVVAVIWLLGVLPTIGFELDPYSILVPFLVFAIGMSHGAQKMNGIMQDIGRGTHRLVAARYTFRRLILAGLTALLADAVGFAVLLIIDIRVIQDLAITASIGMAALIFTNLVLLPVLLSYTGVSARAAQRSLKAELAGAAAGDRKPGFWSLLDRFTQRKWAGATLAVAGVLGVAGFAGSQHLKIGDLDPGAAELRQDSRYNRDNAFMTASYAASSDIFVAMIKTAPGECASYANLVKADALEWELQQLSGVESTNSLAAVAKKMSVGMNEGSLLWYEIPRSQSMINPIVSRAPREVLNQSCDLLSVYVYLKDHKADTLTAVVNTVESFARRNDSHDVKILQAAGNAGIEAATNIVVKKANTQMLLLVYAAVVILAFITFRSWRGVICAVVPLMLTSVLCEALMVGLGIGVKVATLPVIALGVGIGVDYALYMLTVMLSFLRKGASLSQAYYQALLFTGRVVVLTGVTLGLAVATWSFSSIKFQADMGILLAFMFLWNMIGALLLLPALSYFLFPEARHALTTPAQDGQSKQATPASQVL